MGRFHRHPDGTEHDHGHGDAEHDHRNAPRDVGDHSGYPNTGPDRIAVLEDILSENDRIADANRKDLAGVRTINIMSSPGAGKTTLLRRTLAELRGRQRSRADRRGDPTSNASVAAKPHGFQQQRPDLSAHPLRVGVLEGDIATSIDADRLADLGAEVSLVNTSKGFGGECHLDAVMVRSGLARLPIDRLDLLLIENVGNLVCPAEFDVGEDARAMVYAVTEGEDKPLKYPVMFRAVDVVVVNKVDLLPHLDFDMGLFLANLRGVNPRAQVIRASGRTGEGVDAWCAWLVG